MYEFGIGVTGWHGCCGNQTDDNHEQIIFIFKLESIVTYAVWSLDDICSKVSWYGQSANLCVIQVLGKLKCINDMCTCKNIICYQ